MKVLSDVWMSFLNARLGGMDRRSAISLAEMTPRVLRAKMDAVAQVLSTLHTYHSATNIPASHLTPDVLCIIFSFCTLDEHPLSLKKESGEQVL